MFLLFNLYTVASNLNPLIRRSPTTTLPKDASACPIHPTIWRPLPMRNEGYNGNPGSYLFMTQRGLRMKRTPYEEDSV